MRARAPAVVARDAHLPERGADDGVVDGRQLVRVAGALQLVRRVGQRGELHALAGQAQAAAAHVGHLRPAHAGAVAALLRDEIGRQVVPGRRLPDAQPCALTAIAVAFLRAHAVPANPVVVGVQLEHHAELRHVAQPLDRVVVQRHVDCAAGMDGVGHIAGGRRRGRQRIGEADADGAVARLPHLRLAGEGGIAQVAVQRGELPLAVARGHLVAAVVVRGRAPEVGRRNASEHLHAAEFVGDQAVLRIGEQRAEMIAVHAQVHRAADDAQRCVLRVHGRLGHRPHALPEGDLVAARGPGRALLQREGDGRGVLAAARLRRKGQPVAALLQRRNGGFERRARDFHAVPGERDGAVKRGGVQEHVAVVNDHAALRHVADDILVVVLDLLHLRALASVAEEDAVAGEVAVVRAVAEVAAVAQAHAAEAVLRADALVQIVPDEAALEQRLLVGVLRVLVHCAVGIAHRVRVFAQDVRLVAVLLQVFTDLHDGDVHRGDHVALLGIAGDAVRALVVDDARVVKRAEAVRHRVDHLAAGGLVAAGPHEDAGVVLVALVGGVHAVEQDGEPVHAVAGQQVILRLLAGVDHVPHAVRLHVVLVDDVQAQLVRDAVQAAGVRVVAGADGVDVVALHGDQVAAHLPFRHGAAALGAVVVTVHALEDDALPVEAHHAVHNFKAAEAHLLADELGFLPVLTQKRQLEIVQVRRFGAPEPGRGHGQGEGDRGRGVLLGHDDGVLVLEREGEAAAKAVPGRELHGDLERRVGIAVVQQRLHPDILHVHIGRRVEEHITEQAGKAHEILILEPAAGAPAHHLTAELVFARDEVGRQLKVAGRERVGREADVVAVEPDDDAALRALKGDEHAPAGKALRQEEVLAVAGDGVEILGDFADFDGLPAVPGVLHVAVLRHAVALHLDVRGHGDVRPAAAVVVGRFKAVDGLAEVQRVVELPQAA